MILFGMRKATHCLRACDGDLSWGARGIRQAEKGDDEKGRRNPPLVFLGGVWSAEYRNETGPREEGLNGRER